MICKAKEDFEEMGNIFSHNVFYKCNGDIPIQGEWTLAWASQPDNSDQQRLIDQDKLPETDSSGV